MTTNHSFLFIFLTRHRITPDNLIPDSTPTVFFKSVVDTVRLRKRWWKYSSALHHCHIELTWSASVLNWNTSFIPHSLSLTTTSHHHRLDLLEEQTAGYRSIPHWLVPRGQLKWHPSNGTVVARRDRKTTSALSVWGDSKAFTSCLIHYVSLWASSGKSLSHISRLSKTYVAILSEILLERLDGWWKAMISTLFAFGVWDCSLTRIEQDFFLLKVLSMVWYKASVSKQI